jgi:hypothetical protein
MAVTLMPAVVVPLLTPMAACGSNLNRFRLTAVASCSARPDSIARRRQKLHYAVIAANARQCQTPPWLERACRSRRKGSQMQTA